MLYEKSLFGFTKSHQLVIVQFVIVLIVIYLHG